MNRLELCRELEQCNCGGHPERKRHRVEGDAHRDVVDEPIVFRVHGFSPSVWVVRPDWLLASPVLHLCTYTDETQKGSVPIVPGERECHEWRMKG